MEREGEGEEEEREDKVEESGEQAKDQLRSKGLDGDNGEPESMLEWTDEGLWQRRWLIRAG